MGRSWPWRGLRSSRRATRPTAASPPWRKLSWPRPATRSKRPARRRSRKMRGAVKPLWLSEMVAVWGYVQRNYFLTKRYFMWEVVWLVYVTINAMAITYIGAGIEAAGGRYDGEFWMTYLLVGALLWNYLSMLFDVLSETASRERGEGALEHRRMRA